LVYKALSGMKKIMNSFLRYLLFWVLFFVVIRATFIGYHIKPFSAEHLSDILGAFVYGLRLDLSMASYFSVLPFLLIGSMALGASADKMLRWLRYYTYLLLGLVSFLTVADMELFSFWGYRLDGTPLKYLNTPGEMLASTLSSPWYLLIPIFILLLSLAIVGYKKLVEAGLRQQVSEKHFWPRAILVLLLTVALIIPIRGGLQLIPINESAVYFSSSNLCNQAAINLPWTFFHSLLEKSYSDQNPYEYIDQATVDSYTQQWKKVQEPPHQYLIKNDSVNVLIVLWESFTSKADNDSVTPQFQQLKREGVYFNNILATGDRSDKGIVGVLSGYPAQPVTSIIMNPNKSSKLPSLVRDFEKRNYATSFYYGGELGFANMNSFLVQNRFAKIVGKDKFDAKDMNAKWGAHDEVVFGKMLEDLSAEKAPFFSMIFTLSSHEPYDIPVPQKFQGGDKTQQFLSSLHYTDQCLGKFIDEAKKTSWWPHTLVIVIADHGHVLPGSYYAQHIRSEFQIPMLWLGGALTRQDTSIAEIGSQTDLAATLLAQFAMPDSAYTFSRNILSEKYRPSAFFAFNDGLGWADPEGNFTFDNVSKKIIHQQGTVSEEALHQARMWQQAVFRNYLDK
jgi:phosphoglycerol transferase MdoB-like AlkP superfamily enzyme